MIKAGDLFDFHTTCPHCEKQFKLDRLGREVKEFIQCPHCRKIIKIGHADQGEKAIRMSLDSVD